ncbi:hypothetical protein FBALC1_03187 [Flavobacteriales bacterium ALC-1]|nr:hypothetical protein FBALC1_03187 [Flavobacteriales bacterium ALC-1]
MKIYFHIGIHKTATTFLQKQILPNVNNLVYCDRVSHAEFKRYILYTDDFEFKASEAFNLFFKGVESNLTTYFYSDEEFYCSPWDGAKDRKKVIDRLTKTFENISFVVVIRNQKHLLNSLYLQYVKTGGTMNVKKFIGHKKYPLVFTDSYFNYYHYLKYMFGLVGAENVNVMLYEDFIKDKANFVNEFLESIESKPKILSEIDYNKKSNRSLSPILLPYIRFRNRFISSPKNPSLFLPLVFYKMFKRADLFLSKLFPSSNKEIIKKDISSEFLKDCISDNVKLETLINRNIEAEGYLKN